MITRGAQSWSNRNSTIEPPGAYFFQTHLRRKDLIEMRRLISEVGAGRLFN